MLRLLKKKRSGQILYPAGVKMIPRRMSWNFSNGQTIVEYVITVALVMVVITTMNIYFKRLLQARLKDARDYMMNSVRLSYNGTIPDEYEPYYAEQNADVTRSMNDAATLLPGGTTGIFSKTYNEVTSANVETTQLPPQNGY